MRLAPRRPLVLLAAFVLCLSAVPPAAANNSAQTLPFSQDWTNIGLITADNDWAAVPGIEGFRGDGITGGTGVDPQTLLASDTPGVINVEANETNPSVFATGGVAEFHIANPTAALNGSGTADAPYIKLYLNTTGCTGINIAYNLRDLDASVDNAVQPVALHFRLGNSGNFTNVAAGFVADATTGPSVATLVTPVSATLPAAADNQAEVQVRVMTSNAVGNDEWVGVDDISVTGTCGGGATLSIGDATVTEGDAGTVTATFSVTVTSGSATFDIATQDDTAQDDNPLAEDEDYVASSLTGQSVTAGSPYLFNITVNGDTEVEPNETFFVNVTNVSGATLGDGQGVGTINNDDVALTPIHDIQGPGASSPLSGSVTTRGIVTGVKSNGFFIQEPDASVDADPATSEGILVFTSSAPPAAAAVGNYVQVTGTISEFVPSADPLQPPLTELTSPTVVQLSTGNPLPAAIPLTATFPDPAGVHDQLERLEGMRVSVASLTVSGPTLGTVNEPNATATSTGVFYGVVTGVPRPYREAGIQAPDPAPSGGGTIPPIPRFDSNPERIRVDSDALTGGPLVDVNSGAVVTGLIGPLDYSFRTYTIDPDPGAVIGVAGGATATSVAAPTGQEFTVAGYNMERFFDTVNDPGIGEPVLTATAFDNRLNKASLGIRNNLGMPDILGVVEMENLTTLQALASRISADAIAASQPDPEYDAYLVEGNDVGGIDVGFLVKTSEVAPGTPRVEVVDVQQELDATLFTNPNATTDPLNDRPPLRLNAIVHHPNGASFPVTVIVNHLRSLNGVNSEAAGTSGWSTEGARVRAKRQEQAEDLANLVQARQTADPTEHIILVGDFNAFEVNDGLGDSMDVIAGTPVPDNETAVPGDGFDLVNPDLDNLFDTPPVGERYGYIFDGNAQNLDHFLVNAPLIADTTARRIEHPRINTDYAQTARNNSTTPVRLSDHDPVVGFFQVAGFATADLSITKVEGADPVTAGTNLSYTITVTNGGPDAAVNVSWSDTLPAGTTFVSLSSVAGWSCTDPGVGASGVVQCSNPSLAVGSAAFTLTVAVTPSVAAGTVLSNTADVSTDTADPDTDDHSATETTTVAASADLSATKTDAVDPIAPGATQTYTITMTNDGPSDAASAGWSDTLPVGTTFLSLASPGGWSCSTPAVGSGGVVSCSIASLPVGSPAVFTLEIVFDSGLADGTIVTNTATASSATSDPQSGNDSGSADTTVSTAGTYFTVTPCRAVDTRSSSPLQDGVPQNFALHGVCGIPVTATTVVLNVTAVDPTGDGDLTVYAADAAPPGFPTLPFLAGKTRALIVVAVVSQDAAGEITVQASVAGGGTVDVVVDVMGYFE